MLIYAGKTFSNRYDRRAPVHIAVMDPDSDVANGALSMCSGIVIAPINTGGTIEVTCRSCQTEVQRLMAEVSATAA